MIRAATIAAAAAVLAGSLAAGCEEPPVAPPILTSEPSAPPRPTTQELVQGPRTSIPLGSIPLTVRAPAGWAVKNMEGTSLTLLEGPTPAGEASIQFNDRPLTSAAKLEILASGAKREMEQFPESIKMADLRTIAGGTKVLERQRVGRMPAPSPDDEPGVKLSPPFSWTVTVFVARGGGGADYETYELNFIGLTADQYEADKALLREIIDSVTVTAAAPSTAPADAAAPPPPR